MRNSAPRAMIRVLAVLVLSNLLAVERGLADDWPQWLGPRRDGVWRESGIVERFPDGGPRLRWRVEIGGGYSGPAVADGRVFVMDRIAGGLDPRKAKHLHKGEPPRNENFLRKLLPGKERIVCLREADGKILWVHEYDCPYTVVATYGTGPRATPAVDDGRVYSIGTEGHLFCLGAGDGKVIWSRDFRKDYGLEVPNWGISSHPLLDGDLLICVAGGRDGVAIAFDKRTGKEIWRALEATEPGYSSPMICEIAGKRQLIVWHSDAINALDPKSGKVYWSVPLGPMFAMAIGSPRVQKHSLFVMSYNRQSAMIEIDPTGQSASIAWKGAARRGIGGVMDTPFIDGDHIYGCGPSGRYICARLEDGEHVWTSYAPSTGDRPAGWANVFTIRHESRYFLANDFGDLISDQRPAP